MLEEPIVEREEEGLAEEVGDGSLGDGHGPEAAAAEEVGEQVAGVVEHVPLLRLGRLLLLLVDAGRLAPEGEEAPPARCGWGGRRGADDRPGEQRGGGGRCRGGHGAGGRERWLQRQSSGAERGDRTGHRHR